MAPGFDMSGDLSIVRPHDVSALLVQDSKLDVDAPDHAAQLLAKPLDAVEARDDRLQDATSRFFGHDQDGLSGNASARALEQLALLALGDQPFRRDCPKANVERALAFQERPLNPLEQSDALVAEEYRELESYALLRSRLLCRFRMNADDLDAVF